MTHLAGFKGTVLVLAALLAGAGCQRLALKQKALPKPFVPPPVVVRTMPLEPLIVGEPPPNPGLYADIASIPYPIFGGQLELPERPKTPVVRTRPPAQTPVQPEPIEPTPPVVPVPKLTQIMPEDEAKRYRADVDEASKAAERVLGQTSRRPLNATQAEMAQQIRNFLRQAQAQSDTDLVTARNLARRAAILARDLQSTLR